MKSLKFKILLPVMLISFAAFSPLKGVNSSAPGSGRFQKERMDIRTDLSNIHAHKAAAEMWKIELKSDRKLGLKGDAIMDRKEISKSKASEMEAKRFLAADKKDFKRDYRLAVNEQEREVRLTKASLRRAKAQMRKDERRGYGSATETRNASKVSALTHEFNFDRDELDDIKLDMKLDKREVRNEIRASKG